MIVTINMINDKKENFWQFAILLLIREIFQKSRFCKHIRMHCLLALMMQNVTMGHLQMSLRKHLRKYVGNIRR